MPIKLLLALGLAAIALAALATLARSPLTLAGGNGVPLALQLRETRSDARACQGQETVPAGTTALRLGLFSLLGSRIAVRVLAGSRVVTVGERAPGWDGTYVVVPVRRVAHTVLGATVCISLSTVDSRVALLGVRTAASVAARDSGGPLPGRMGIEYLRPGQQRWWSLAGTIAERLGFGHALTGAWDVVLASLLAASVLVLSSVLIVRELR